MRTLRLSVLLAASASVAPAQGPAAPAPVASPDLPLRSATIHWPRGYDPATAQGFAHNALAIAAPCARVWTHLTDAARWPDWYALAKDVRFVGPGAGPGARAGARLAADARIRWRTFGLVIESRVGEFVPGERLGWFNNIVGQAPAYYQTWLLTPAGGGAACAVVTEKVGLGPDAAAATRAGDVGAHRAHDLWLASLKWVAEPNRPGAPAAARP